MALLLCTAPRTREALFSTFSSRFLNQPPARKLKSVSAVSVPQPHRARRHIPVVSVKQEGLLLRSPELVALEYAELNLSDKVSEELGHVRIRQHVNPLRSSLLVPAPLPDWNEVFKDPTLPLMVDIGSGSGRFLMWLAKRNPDRQNYLGLEIRQKLVKRAEYWVNELALSNIHFVFANATVSFKQIVSTYPGPLMLVSILCPDPHFKKKYHKRRVVQEPLVKSMVDSLTPGGKVCAAHINCFTVTVVIHLSYCILLQNKLIYYLLSN
ncbi:tRNA (guanine(46)-N(7))-methyltransferase [Sarracenia purpurea var. burkii]